MASIIRITSKVEGFRRAGMAHPARPVDHLPSRCTREQLKQLQNEPMLVVQIEKERDDKGGGKAE